MSYIVLDLEWNQAMNAQSSIFDYLPIHLSGEIIQIGAVKLNDDNIPGDEFQSYVKPVYFRRMHYKVKKITGIDKELLNQSDPFPVVFKRLRDWCGDDPTFITWGNDDRRILEQNIIIHDLDWDWISGWINLQVIYNLQTDLERNQKSLSTATEHFAIEQTRTAHDALGDAYNTALVCSRLDLEAGIKNYENANSLLSSNTATSSDTGDALKSIDHRSFSGYSTRIDAFADPQISMITCPDCNSVLNLSRWVNQGDRRYMCLATCAEHGDFLLRMKFRKAEDGSWAVNRIIYRADDNMKIFYKDKVSRGKRRKKTR